MEGMERKGADWGEAVAQERRLGAIEELDVALAELHDTISGLADALEVVLQPQPPEDPKLQTVAALSPLRGRTGRLTDATARLRALRQQLDL